MSEQRSLERTFAMIKPDAAAKTADIIFTIQQSGFTILQQKTLVLTEDQAGEFYAEHNGKPFFSGLISFITSGPVTALVLAKENAIADWRELIGPTDPNKAKVSHPKSIRALFGTNGQRNAVHGSDSTQSAAREILFMFPQTILEPLPTSAQAKEAITKNLNPVLLRGLIELCKVKPSDPISWLGKWLLDNNPNKPRVTEPPEVAPYITLPEDSEE
eukprot:Colp12_sorted_trinity150504_noHs@5425